MPHLCSTMLAALAATTLVSPPLIADGDAAAGPTGAHEQPQRPAFSKGLAAELEAAIDASLQAVPIPGMAVGVVINGEPAYSRGFGVADLSTKEPITADTLFQIGSISKSFTATLGAILVERGKLSWDDPAAKHIPHAHFPDRSITLRQLARHTSGLPGDAPTLRRLHGDDPVLAFTHFELYRSLEESEVRFPPGSAWGYSNFGYAVLGHAIERVTETPYEVLVDREVFKPLGMDSSTVTLWPKLAQRLATPYHLQNGKLETYPAPWDEEALAPAGGLSSTVRDLERYLVYQMEQSTRGGAVAELQTAQVNTGGNAYGSGWFVEESPGTGRLVSVGGDVDGYVGELVFAPQHGIGTVVLVNSGDAAPLPYIGRWLIASLRAEADAAAKNEARYYRGMMHQAIREWSPAVQAFSELSGVDGSPHLGALYQIGRTAALSGQHLPEGVRALEEYVRHEPLRDIPRAAAYWAAWPGAYPCRSLRGSGICVQSGASGRSAVRSRPRGAGSAVALARKGGIACTMAPIPGVPATYLRARPAGETTGRKTGY